VAPVLDVDAAAVAIGAPVRADDLEVVEGIGPKIAELLHARGIRTWAGLAATEPAAIRTMLDDAGPNYRVADPATWPHQAALLAWGRWAEFRALTDDLVAGRGRVGTAPAGATDTTERAAFAVAAGSDVVDVTGAAAILGTRVLPDDLKVVEGIGPKIEELLHGGGIHTWRELADAPVERLKAILDAAGSRYQIHDPSTWPRQAALLVGARWGEFKEFTDQLRGGRA
jgi:predicted flap endonuclease-1-like 5' DNA nuclease